MLSIVTIICGNLDDIEKTCASMDRQDSIAFQHIIVASGFSPEEKDLLLTRWHSTNRRFIFDQDRSLYNAMNIGLRAAKGSCVLFLNGGDVLVGSDALSMISGKQGKSCMAFSTAQRYEEDLYIRPPCRITNGSVTSCGHQGFVTPLDPSPAKRIYYNESNYISADQEWIRENIKHYGVDLHEEVLSVFQLGGISNRPSTRVIKLQLKAANYRSVVKLLAKIILYAFLRPRLYYYLMARFNRYKILDQ